MAATVNWDALRELAGFRAEKGCSISFYWISTRASRRPRATRRPTSTRCSSEGERSNGAARPDLTHDQTVGAALRLRAHPPLLRAGLRPRRRARLRGLLLGARQPLVGELALDRAGAGRDQGRARALPRAARAARRPRRRRARRRRRAASAARSSASRAGGSRRWSTRSEETPRPPRPGRLVAGALPAAHRGARRRPPPQRGRGARPPRAPHALAEGRRGRQRGDARGARVGALERGARTRSSAGRRPRRTPARPSCSRSRRRCSSEWRSREEERVLERWREETARNGRGVVRLGGDAGGRLGRPRRLPARAGGRRP